ncbi:MAG: RdgB/HAM1 family non-canonical purine NTP pyrophosphatase [Bacteroidota bacterium]
MDLIFATHNEHKTLEVDRMVGDSWNVKSLKDIDFLEEVPETGQTLEENAIEKARFIYDRLGADCFADDTGFEIDALGGEPGVFSARYAGPEKDSKNNIAKVLKQMDGHLNRKARFRTVIALMFKGELHLFKGEVQGIVLKELQGEGGFGYDPVFKPDGYDISFAEMSVEEKNRISHRGRAFKKLVTFLKNETNEQNI